MIVCRSFSRVDRVWKVASVPNVLSKPERCSQCFPNYYLSYISKMSGAKDGSNVVDQYKKRKTAVPVWRPVSTQSSSYEENLAKEVKIEPGKSFGAVDCSAKSDLGYQVQAVHLPTSSVSDIQNLNQDAEPKGELAGPLNSSTSALNYSNLVEDVEVKGSISSTTGIEENMPQSQCHTSDSKSNKTPYQEQLEESTTRGLESGVNDELVKVVEKHLASVEVDSSLIRFVKGKGGSTQRQIEEETGVKIIFSSSKGETSVVIEGASIKNVTKASEKIKGVLEEAVKSTNLDYSHFISLPLAIHPELVEKLNSFQNSILGDDNSKRDGNLENDSNEDTSGDEEDKDDQLEHSNVAVKLEVQDDKEQVKVELDTTSLKSSTSKQPRSSVLADMGIDRSIFIKPKTFHLTVLMLKLWNKDRVAAATEVLQRIDTKVNEALGNQPISIRLKGLECMRGSPAKARVLYAPVEEIGGEGRLLRACQVIIEAYVEAGLVLEKDARNTLKLHATLMNARHRKRKNRTRRYDSFDARGIFKRFGSEEWGEYLIREAHLSQRFAFNESGYYHCCASIPFPENMQIE